MAILNSRATFILILIFLYRKLDFPFLEGKNSTPKFFENISLVVIFETKGWTLGAYQRESRGKRPVRLKIFSNELTHLKIGTV